MPRHSKKKRKGFFGKRPQDFEASLDIFESTDDANEPGESGEGSQRRNPNKEAGRASLPLLQFY